MNKTAEILFETADHSVVKLPYRKFPSITFQGDSLYIFLMSLKKLKAYADNKELLMEEISLLEDELNNILINYNYVLLKIDYKIPY